MKNILEAQVRLEVALEGMQRFSNAPVVAIKQVEQAIELLKSEISDSGTKGNNENKYEQLKATVNDKHNEIFKTLLEAVVHEEKFELKIIDQHGERIVPISREEYLDHAINWCLEVLVSIDEGLEVGEEK
ncbi:hypothetical protein CN692_22970 [Bacillus sp. AFS002410]|uniref:hypothetical protein n=1 Tax=Bacillus sp. AFS002410 TaxID=2033481 RepID=UPI000BF0680A|nr:hypothetical protein [Bacillus sp. AFS002410]PEJ49784.1 hypothetical protein CN692_22970 [Bacillus sp. AFS002410]